MPLLSHLPTPVERMDRLGGAIGLEPDRLWVKRDDLTGLAGGGNKARKLDHLCADALARGCDVLVTGGGRQSNHVRMTAAAANRLGLGCTIVLSSTRPSVPSGNVLLDELLAVDIEWAGALGYHDLEARIVATAERLGLAGHRPYAIPIGGASDLGALGYVEAALELTSQLDDIGLVVVADGSGGTHAGLVAGLGDHALVLGVDVGARDDLESAVPAKARSVAALAARAEPVGTVKIDGARVGPGYAVATPDGREALDLAARREGLVLDPAYTGKAMAGLVAAAREDRLPPGRIVFLHTGGMPALFAASYADWIRSPQAPTSQ